MQPAGVPPLPLGGLPYLKTGLKKTGPGLEKALRELADKAAGARVVIGVLGSTSSRPGEPIDNVELAVTHEFGLGVPERSFLRATFDRLKDKWAKFSARVMKLVASGKLDLEAGLAMIGERVKADVKKAITSGEGIPPPLSQATIDRKGSSRPLVDTARLLGSIDYEVRLKG